MPFRLYLFSHPNSSVCDLIFKKMKFYIVLWRLVTSTSHPLSISPSHNSSRLLAVAVFQCSNRTSADHFNVGVSLRGPSHVHATICQSRVVVSSAKWRRSGSTVVTQRWRSVNRRPTPPPLLFFPWPGSINIIDVCLRPVRRSRVIHTFSRSLSLSFSRASARAWVWAHVCGIYDRLWTSRDPTCVF